MMALWPLTLGMTAAAAATAVPLPSPVAPPGRRVRWVVETSAQPGPRAIEALLPDSWREGERLPVVYVLPVEKEDGRRFGGALDEVARLGLQNRHHVIAVAPTFAQAPWYGDHAKDRGAQQERYVVEDVVPSVDRHLPSLGGAESRFLVGFSKSGWGAFTLMLRHPDTFGGAAAWDAPLMMETLGRWETSEIFGTEDAFDRFRVDRLLRERGAAVGTSRRLVLMGHGRFADDVRGAHALMQSLAVPHQYRDGPARAHRWDSGWLEEAFALLLADRRS
jgi:S-formylglutathione hydrolase FrmB